jgi:hypothetical protein
MNCDQFRKGLADSGALVPSAEALAHVEDCADCAGLFYRHRGLEAGLKQMAAAQAGWSAPSRIEAGLLEQFRARLRARTSTPPRPAPLVRFRVPALASAGALAAVLALLLISRTPPVSHNATAAAISQVADADDDSSLDNGFVPLPYFANSGEIANAAEADVVRVEMPRSTLVTLGVPVNDEGNSETVEAELMLGQGGVPQAVRVLE